MARFHRETKKKQLEVCDRQTDIQTDKVNDNKIIDSSRRGDQHTGIYTDFLF